MNNNKSVKSKKRNSEDIFDLHSKRKKITNNSKTRELQENYENDNGSEIFSIKETKNNLNPDKISLKNLRADLIAYIAGYLEVFETSKIANLNKKSG